MSETNEERSARQSESKRAITRDRYDAVLLDLDGVITDTASIHAACWLAELPYDGPAVSPMFGQALATL